MQLVHARANMVARAQVATVVDAEQLARERRYVRTVGDRPHVPVRATG